MPKNHTEGDIPRIGVLTGGFDPMECVLRKMGVQDTEFTNPGGGGHIQFYLAPSRTGPFNPVPPGARRPLGLRRADRRDHAEPGDALRQHGAAADHQPVRHGHPRVRGLPAERAAADWRRSARTRRRAVASSLTDYAYDWLRPERQLRRRTRPTTGPSQPGRGRGTDTAQPPAHIDLVSNPKGMAFEQVARDRRRLGGRLGHRRASTPSFHNSERRRRAHAAVALLGRHGADPLHVQHAGRRDSSTNQCGRVVFSDWHADNSRRTVCRYRNSRSSRPRVPRRAR